MAKPGAIPYRFFALSNIGSLLALCSFPVLVEPLFSTRVQALGWSGFYAVFVLLCALVAWRTLRVSGTPLPDGRGSEALVDRSEALVDCSEALADSSGTLSGHFGTPVDHCGTPLDRLEPIPSPHRQAPVQAAHPPPSKLTLL